MSVQDTLSGNVVVLIDPYTRKAVENITYDALAKHVTVITDIREITDTNYSCDLIMFEPAVPAIVTPAVISEFAELYGVRAHLIYSTQEVADLFAGRVHAVKADYRTLEWNLIYAVVHEDLAILEPYQRSQAAPLEFAKLIEGLPAEFRAPVDKMYTSYIDLGSALARLINDNSELRETINNYRSVGAKTTAAINELKSLLQAATEENRTYCAMLSESYDVTFNGMYPDRPRVLYIKSISHLSGIDNLLMVLYAVLTKQYKVGCKVVKLVDSANACSVRYVPNVYTPLTDSYNTYDVLTNDFLVTLGAYNILMNLLMLNRSGLDILVVHDMRGTMNDALDSSLVDLKVHEMSGDYAMLGEYENVLSDVPKVSQFLWRFEEVAEHTGSNTAKLANHPTIAKIVDYLI